MKIVVLSDTHGFIPKNIPNGDVLIHAGDITRYGQKKELYDINKWLSSLPHTNKIIIAGNHDWCFQKEQKECINILSEATYLQDSEVIINKVKFYGSPWQPFFNNWAFNLPRNGEELQRKWNMIPDAVDVLISHGPPYGILDVPKLSTQIEHCGCERLLSVVVKKKPKIHIFGHIHGGYGHVSQNDIEFYNVSVCTEEYKPVNLPIEINL